MRRSVLLAGLALWGSSLAQTTPSTEPAAEAWSEAQTSERSRGSTPQEQGRQDQGGSGEQGQGAQGGAGMAGTSGQLPPEQVQRLVRSAASAAPPAIGNEATVALPQQDGSLTILRQGRNAFTCFPDSPDTPGNDPMCADPQGLKWAQSWMRKEAKPANTAPGVIYMLQGGSDVSATDPFATPRPGQTFLSSPPHWMIVWPFSPEQTGLPTQPAPTGSWVMWAGTPYAHLMINQDPMPQQPRASARRGPGQR